MINLGKYGWNFIHKDSSFNVERDSGFNEYILLIIRSPFFMSLNGTECRNYDRNSIVLIAPDTPHFYGINNSESFINDWLCFTSDEALPLETNKIYENIDGHIIEHFSVIINEIITERREAHLNSEEIIYCQLKYLLLKIQQVVSVSTLNTNRNIHYPELLTARNNILASFQNDICIDDFAFEAHLSPSFFKHLYKEFFGISPQADLINTRLNYAKYLLQNTDSSVSRIASDCGYKNHEHFMRQFKKKFGTTPSKIR